MPMYYVNVKGNYGWIATYLVREIDVLPCFPLSCFISGQTIFKATT